MADRYLFYLYYTKMETNGYQETHMPFTSVIVITYSQTEIFVRPLRPVVTRTAPWECLFKNIRNRLLLKRQSYLVRQTVSGGESSRCRSETLLVVLAPKDAMWHSNFSRLDAFCSVSHSGSVGKSCWRCSAWRRAGELDSVAPIRVYLVGMRLCLSKY